jgi:hypothetical protein
MQPGNSTRLLIPVLDKITEVSFNQNAAKLRDKWLLWWLEKIYGKKSTSNVAKTAVRGEITSRLFKRENQLLSKIVPAFILMEWVC